jgi:glycosyltransferase involved in cell wall biosynthesis
MPEHHLLFLSTEALVLPLTGGSLRTLHLLRGLVKEFRVTGVLPQSRSQFEACLQTYPELQDADWKFKEDFQIPNPRKLSELPHRLRSKWSAFVNRRHWREAPLMWSFGPWSFWNEPIRRLISEQIPDVVFIEHTRHAQSLWLARALAPNAFRVVSSQNVESDLVRQLLCRSGRASLAKTMSAQIARKEAQLNRLCDLLWCCSLQDLKRYQAMGITKAAIRLVPNGVDTDAISFQQRCMRTNEPIVLFIGTISYQPNQDGIHWFHTMVWPGLKARFPGIKWFIVGRFPTSDVLALAETDPSIQVHADVVSTQPFLDRADVAICPLMTGSGTRLKILEAFSAGVPMVSTQLGAEGIEAKHAESIYLADTPKEFEAAIAELIESPEQADSVRTAARQLVESKYEWVGITSEAIQDLLIRLDARKSKPADGVKDAPAVPR